MPKANLKAVALKALEGTTTPKGEHYVAHLHDRGYKIIPRALIRPNPEQPRQHVDKKPLEELAASIKTVGVLQPLIVRPDPEEKEHFIIIAGERRFQAAGLAELDDLPCIIRDHADHQEIALIENLQREDLTPLEEAEGLQKLQTAKGYTHQQLAQVIGKSRTSVTESLALNDLPEPVKRECRTSDNWSKSQLLHVLRAGSPQKLAAAWEALRDGKITTVRELRRRARHAGGRPKNYRFEYQPDDRRYQVTVSFAKKTASRAELRAALKGALKHLPEVHA